MNYDPLRWMDQQMRMWQGAQRVALQSLQLTGGLVQFNQRALQQVLPLAAAWVRASDTASANAARFPQAAANAAACYRDTVNTLLNVHDRMRELTGEQSQAPQPRTASSRPASGTAKRRKRTR